MDKASLARKNLERRLAPLRKLQFARPPHGWLRAIRESLGMASSQFADRLGVVPSRITALEKAEVQGTVTLKTLREAAEALECELVYALVPRQSLDETLRARAVSRAEKDLARVHHTMRLENQGLTPEDLAEQRERKIAELMNGSPRRLWDDR